MTTRAPYAWIFFAVEICSERKSVTEASHAELSMTPSSQPLQKSSKEDGFPIAVGAVRPSQTVDMF